MISKLCLMLRSKCGLWCPDLHLIGLCLYGYDLTYTEFYTTVVTNQWIAMKWYWGGASRRSGISIFLFFWNWSWLEAQEYRESKGFVQLFAMSRVGEVVNQPQVGTVVPHFGDICNFMQFATAVQWSIAGQARFVASYFMFFAVSFVWCYLGTAMHVSNGCGSTRNSFFLVFGGTLGLREKAMLDTWLGYQNKLVVRASWFETLPTRDLVSSITWLLEPNWMLSKCAGFILSLSCIAPWNVRPGNCSFFLCTRRTEDDEDHEGTSGAFQKVKGTG